MFIIFIKLYSCCLHKNMHPNIVKFVLYPRLTSHKAQSTPYLLHSCLCIIPIRLLTELLLRKPVNVLRKRFCDAMTYNLNKFKEKLKISDGRLCWTKKDRYSAAGGDHRYHLLSASLLRTI